MKISNVKIGIGIPISYHLLPTEFFESFITMEKPDFTYIRPRGEDDIDPRQQRIDAMRNDIVSQAIISRCTHLLMMDTDQMYPVDTLVKLMSHKKPIVGARIRRRYPPFDNLMFRGEIGSYVNIPKEECLSGELVEVDATGTGCILFEMSVFEFVQTPWFRVEERNGRMVGEDFAFCSRLRRSGYKIYVDTSIYLPHLSQFGITDSFANIYEHINKIVMERETKEDNKNGI